MLRIEVSEGGPVLPPVDVDDVTFAIGSDPGARIRLPAAGAVATPPQRTESLARELMRSLLGTGAAPTLEIEHGPSAGARRALAPPESVLVIGRGDEAGWVILDGDLSKAHAEIRRGWDGVRVVDLDSKNGVEVDGRRVRDHALIDGALIVLANVALRYRDPAERHLRAAEPTPGPSPGPLPAPPGNPLVFYLAVAIMVLALGGIVWLATL